MDRELAETVEALRGALMASIAKREMLAAECAVIADLAARDGSQGFADVLRRLGRMRRIEALELTADLTVLAAEFPGTPGYDG